MELQFELINPENWRFFNVLNVKKEQKNWVASNVTILARAYVYRDYNSIVYAIYNSNTPVGLLLQRDYIENEKTCCVLDQFMITEQFQGKGYGKKAMQQWIALIKKESKYNSITLCYKEEDSIAKKLYESLGFQHTGVVDEDEVIMEYLLK
ncbi:MAG: GNAT family N-acetyltransferase [Solibacillus sp.]|uniref:GNAT family N-acetyltransferase n=1 Tax=unclassified Solibacillus TaxID=2637870 RepID=UPI0030F6A642